MDALYRTRHPRSEAAVVYLSEQSPALTSLALWIAHKDDAEPERGTRTNGTTIWYTKAFETLPLKQQAFTVAHIVLHVALCHAIRGAKMRERERSIFNPIAWNVAADLMVNSALADAVQRGTLEAPKGTVFFRDVQPMLTKIRGGDVDYEEEDVESLYHLLKDARMSLIENPDLEFPDTTDLTDQAMQEWAARLEVAQHGDTPGGLLRKVRDLPVVETPWEHDLRGSVSADIAAKTEESWSRPSRRWLSLHGSDPDHPYNPGIIAKPTPRFAVCVDTSGSITQDLYDRFIAEIYAIHRRTGAELVLIVGDAAVESVTTIQSDEAIEQVTFTGGGGTDFRPLIAEAEKHQIASLVYLTDLMGTFPDIAPPFPVLWAVPEVYKDTDLKAPFGRVLYLK